MLYRGILWLDSQTTEQGVRAGGGYILLVPHGRTWGTKGARSDIIVWVVGGIVRKENCEGKSRVAQRS